MSEYGELAKFIMGNPEARRKELARASAALGPPLETYVVCDEDDWELNFGVWYDKDTGRAFSIEATKSGLYDPRRAVWHTREEITALARVIGLLEKP